MSQQHHMTLHQFLETVQNMLPQFLKVTVGFDDPLNPDNEFSTNDYIKVIDVVCPRVDIRFQLPRNGNENGDNDESASEDTGGRLVRLTVSTRNTTRFRLARPFKPRVYACVKQIINDWPLTVKAGRDHCPALRICENRTISRGPDVLFRKGDLLHLVRLNQQDKQLEFRRGSGVEIYRIPTDYVGPFSEFINEAKLYTLGELTSAAAVPRTLQLRASDRRPGDAWIEGIPEDFDGVVHMESAERLVEVQQIMRTDPTKKSRQPMTLTEPYHLGPKILIPVLNEIRVESREENYVCLNRPQLRLNQLVEKYSETDFPLAVRILNWDEETAVLRNHNIRPYQLLAVFAVHDVEKLSVTCGEQRYLVPLTHGGKFCRVDDNSCIRLADMKNWPSSAFPVRIKYIDDGDYVNLDDTELPNDCAMLASAVVVEKTLFVARIPPESAGFTPNPAMNGDVRFRANKAFHLPLRVKLDIAVEQTNIKVDCAGLSPRDDFADNLSAKAFRTLTSSARPQTRGNAAGSSGGAVGRGARPRQPDNVVFRHADAHENAAAARPTTLGGAQLSLFGNGSKDQFSPISIRQQQRLLQDSSSSAERLSSSCPSTPQFSRTSTTSCSSLTVTDDDDAPLVPPRSPIPKSRDSSGGHGLPPRRASSDLTKSTRRNVQQTRKLMNGSGAVGGVSTADSSRGGPPVPTRPVLFGLGGQRSNEAAATDSDHFSVGSNGNNSNEDDDDYEVPEAWKQ